MLVPSSSGLGRLVLIQKIAGSTPAGITRNKNRTYVSYCCFWLVDVRGCGDFVSHGDEVVAGRV